MPTGGNYICGCGSGQMMKNVRSGMLVEELMADGRPYKVWSADRFQCPKCLSSVIIVMSKWPVSEHFNEGYSRWASDCDISFGSRK